MSGPQEGKDVAKKRKAVDQTSYSGRAAARLVKLREEAGLSVDEVVEKVNKAGFEISGSAYRHWEGALRQINWDAIPAICKALKTKPRDLVPLK